MMTVPHYLILLSMAYVCHIATIVFPTLVALTMAGLHPVPTIYHPWVQYVTYQNAIPCRTPVACGQPDWFVPKWSSTRKMVLWQA